jgi:hypothetical protein
MFKLGDLQTLLKPHNKNWVLIMPLGAVLGPLLSFGRGQENSLPTLLALPSMFFICLFAYSMFVELRAGHHQGTEKIQHSNTPQCVSPSFASQDGYCSYVPSILDGLDTSKKDRSGLGIDLIWCHSRGSKNLVPIFCMLNNSLLERYYRHSHD